MEYRLLIDMEAVAFLDSISKKTRTRLLDHFVALRSAPDQLSDYHEHDKIGRRIEISIFVGYSIHYWVDLTDQHIKILTIAPADR
jgi:hypothetical protein